MSDTAPAIIPMERPKLPSAAQSETAALISMLERAASDPRFDVERLERMYTMYEKASARSSRSAYLAALSEMQPQLPIVAKHGIISRKAKDDSGTKVAAKPTKYALWEDVMEALQPILALHGFSLSFRIAQPTPDRIHITGVLGHKDGHAEETAISLPIDDTGAKNNAQGWGSSVSYGKRYTAGALLNFVARGEDDDATSTARSAENISEEQQATIRDALEAHGKELPAFCKYFNINGLTELPVSQFDRAMQAITRSRR